MVFVNIREMSQVHVTAKRKKKQKPGVLLSKCKKYPFLERGKSHDCCVEEVHMQVRLGNLNFKNVHVI